MPLARSRIILNSESLKSTGSAVPHFMSVKVRWLTKYASERNGVSPNSGRVRAAVSSGMFWVARVWRPGPNTS